MMFGTSITVYANGTVIGHVYDANTHLTLPGATVSTNVNCNILNICTNTQTTSHADGSFEVDDVMPGSGYLGAWFERGGLNYLSADTPLTVVDQQITTLDISLTPGAAITGSVVDASNNAPAAGVYVTLRLSPGSFTSASVMTDASGNFVLDRLTAGTYFVEAVAVARYQMQYFAGHTLVAPSVSPQPADAITLATGETRPDVNFSLQKGGTIAGVVTDRYTGQPIANYARFYLDVFDAHGGSWDDADALVTTDAQGRYSVSGLPDADIQLTVSSSWPFYTTSALGCAINPCSDPGEGAVYHVAADATQQLDFSLFPGSVAAGVVTRRSNGSAVSGATVQAFVSGGGVLATSTTAADGSYTLSNMQDGPFFVKVSDAEQDGTHFFAQTYPDQNCLRGDCEGLGDSLYPPQDVAATGINFALDAGAALAGKVVDRSTGTGIAAYLMIQAADGTYSYVDTNPDGTFASSGLTAGPYYILAETSATIYDCVIYPDFSCDAMPNINTVGQAIVITGIQDVTGLVIQMPRELLFRNGFD